jgi:signal transduction histidine kinase/DNA-binding response OmpR family regulator
MENSNPGSEGWRGRWVGLLVLPGLYLVSRHNFLLFHSLAELFGVVVAFGVFVLAWNSRKFLDNNYLLSLGIAFPFVGALHLVHALAYKGMGVFSGYDPYIATQLWICARFALAVAFLLAPVFLGRKVNINLMFAGWILGTEVLLLSVFVWGILPPMFIEGQGLTSFKKICEYAICVMMLASLVPLWRKRSHFAPNVFRIMAAAVLAAFAAELPFTLYNHVYGFMNALGHLFSIVCFYLVYRALIVTGVRDPHELLFRNLKQSEAALRQSEERLKLALDFRRKMEAERQNLLEAERAARGESERLNRMKDEFLATVSHELRSPLNAIVGWARLLADGRVDTAKAADIIRRSAGSLTQIVEDLLNMSRIISGKIRLKREAVNLLEVLPNVVEGVQFTADAKSIHLEVSYDPELTALDCDPGRVQQIVWNLLTNAIKFTPTGGRVLMAVSQSPTQVTIKVQDTGKGIAPDFLPYVFERFRQEDGGIARHHGGLGLGLAIVRNLVELHGGTVEAQSEGEGKGAIFLVTLPRVAPPSDSAEHLTQGPAVPDEPVRLDEGTLRSVKVLGVDDDAYSRELLARILADAGAIVRTAESPQEAFAVLAEFQPDVLISDVGMPGEDGYTFIRRLRASEDGQGRLPCIAVTALSRPEDRERALTFGFDEHVGKPFDPGVLCMLIAKMIRHGAGSAANVGPDNIGESDREAAVVKPHVLLAEDDTCIAGMLKIILEGEGYRVSLADSTADAARVAKAEPVDLVVSDLVLKDGMGWDLLGKMPGGRKVPGILMSGYSESEYVEKGKAAGFSEYLVKPVDADVLVATVGRVLGRAN